MIADDDIDKALNFLRDHSEEAAQARANRLYLDEFSKSLKAQIMGEHPLLAVNAQEREALSDKRYIAHLAGLREAIYQDEKLRFLLSAAEAKIEAWRTMQANERAMGKVV
jgi:hypothetical protein